MLPRGRLQRTISFRRLPKPMNSAPSAVQTYSHGEAGTLIATAPPTARSTNPAAIAKTSRMTIRFRPYE